MGGNVTIVLGLFWGNECKGKLVDMLSQYYDTVARANGSDDHFRKMEYNNETCAFRVMPFGFYNNHSSLVIGDGFFLNPCVLALEVQALQKAGFDFSNRLIISDKCHIIMPYHKIFDENEKNYLFREPFTLSFGSSSAMCDKVSKDGVQLGDFITCNKDVFKEKFEQMCFSHLQKRIHYIENYYKRCISELDEYYKAISFLSQFIGDTTSFIHSQIKKEKYILVEGPSSSMLDVTSGNYPFVSSDFCTSGAICSSLGIGPKAVSEVIGVTRPYCTKDDYSPLVTSVDNETNSLFTEYENENDFCPPNRRFGWLDLVALKYSCMINGVTSLAITRLDTIGRFDKIKVCTGYRDKISNAITNKYSPRNEYLASIVPHYLELEGNFFDIVNSSSYGTLPVNALNFLNLIEDYLEIPIQYISTGASKEYLIRVPV